MENYNIYDEIGRGTHSFVYKARRKRSIEYVAVKSTAKSRMDKILNEVQILHKLDSQHVLKFYNWYESQNHIWLIFEYCIGGDLLNLITQDKQLPEARVKDFGWELVAGLQYLHSHGILYCDLKPANILIDECGSLKLADFGLARRITKDANTKPLAPGSPNYMAPELFQQTAIHSFASDFWALGCVLYELFTGRLPFTHTNFSELARIIQTSVLELPVAGFDMSPEFVDLLQRLLEKDPYKRIEWNELLRHSFWSGLPLVEDVQFPFQDVFEASRPANISPSAPIDREELPTESVSIALSENTHASRENPLVASNQELSQSTGTQSDSSDTARENEHEDEEENDSAMTLDVDEENDEEATKSESRLSRLRPVTAPVGAKAPRSATLPLPPQTAPQRSISSKSDLKTRLSQNGGTTVSSRSLKKPSRLLFTSSDSTVKSIGFINEEKTPIFDVERLDFDIPMTPEELLSCGTEELETHLKMIYISLKQSISTVRLHDKLNVLAYLFTLCLQPKLANVIVNSSMLTLLIKMLHQAHRESPERYQLVSMVALVLGVLFRFATFIASTSPEHIHSLTQTLCEIALEPMSQSQDSSTQRCRAIACLGELLFYLSTQPPNSTNPDHGMIATVALGIECLVSTLEDRVSDTTANLYATRTIANMLTHGGMDTGLVTERVALVLIRTLLWCDTQQDTTSQCLLMRTAASRALSNLIRRLRFPSKQAQQQRLQISTGRIKTAVMLHLSRPNVLTTLWRGVEAGSNGHSNACDLAVASLNILNTYLEVRLDPERDGEHAATLVEEHKRMLLTRIVHLSIVNNILQAKTLRYEDNLSSKSHTTPIIQRYMDDEETRPSLLRGKIMLFLYFGIHSSKRFAQLFIREHILDGIEHSLVPFSPMMSLSESLSVHSRLSTLDLYVIQCGLNVIRLSIRTALKLAAECIAGNGDVDYDQEEEQEDSTVSATPFVLFEQLLIKNTTCRSQLLIYFLANEGKEFTFFLRLMSKLLVSFSNESLSLAIPGHVGAHVSLILLRLVSSTNMNQSVSIGNDTSAALITSEAEEIFAHLLPAVITQLQDKNEQDEEHIVNCIRLIYVILLHLQYDLTTEQENIKNLFIRNQLLPCFSILLSDQTIQSENVWRFAVDLLSGLVIRDPTQLVQQICACHKDLHLLDTIVALLDIPRQRGYATLPSTVTVLVKSVIEVTSKYTPRVVLLENGIAKHIQHALLFIRTLSSDIQETVSTATLDLLEILYYVLHYTQYHDLRSGSSKMDFEMLVHIGPLLLEYCTLHGDENDIHPQEITLYEEIADVASRCLVYLSKTLGDKLNEILFGRKGNNKTLSKEINIISRSIRISLEMDTSVSLHILHLLKHCLRCQHSINNTSKVMTRWFQEHSNILTLVKRIATTKRSTRSNLNTEQMNKVALEIIRQIEKS